MLAPSVSNPSADVAPADASLADSVPEPFVLPPRVFAGSITAGRSDLTERLGAWAEAAREALRATSREMASRDEPVEDWERAAFDAAAHECRILSAFHALHEQARCPGLLFRLQTRRDFRTLCDRGADSGPAGYGEHQRRVLTKRGIACRRSWAAARALVAEIGLVDGTIGVGGTVVVDAAETTASDHRGTKARVLCDGAAEDDREAMDEAGGLPVLHLASVYGMLGGMTKAGLEAVVTEYGVGLWAQFGERFYPSLVKADMLQHARRVVRHHACLDAAQRLDEAEVETLYEWMRGALSAGTGGGADTGRAQRDPDVRIAARLFRDFLACAALSANGRGLSPEAWNRYRGAELRRIGAFCYHAFYDDRQSVQGAA